MSDDTPGSGAPSPAPETPQASQQQPQQPGALPAAPQVPLAVIAQYIRDLSFENPRAPQVFNSAATPQSAASVTVGTRQLAERTYEVTLNMRIEGKVNDETAYIVELSYGGVFAIGAVPNELIEPLLMIEAPRLLFPFARSIAASATREGGFPQILVNPIDFGAMYRNRVQQAAAKAAAAAPAAPTASDAAPADAGAALNGSGKNGAA
jgi:preprotein translocase subunit SecB